MENDNQQLLPQDNFEQDKVPLAVPAEVQQAPIRCDGDNNNNNNSNNSNNKSNNSNNNIGSIGNNSNICNSNNNSSDNIDNNLSNYISSINNNNSCINRNNASNSDNSNGGNNIGNNSNMNNSIGIINNIGNNRSAHNICNINSNSNSIGDSNSNHVGNSISNNNNCSYIRNIFPRRNNRNRNNCNRLYTVELGPTSAMLVYISPERFALQQQQQQQQDSSTPSSWRISTLLIHNGQHYRNVIRYFAPRPEFMRTFDQRLLNITRPVEFQRLPMLPLNVFHMVEFYCQQLITASHNLEEVFEQHSLLPAMVLTLRHTTNTLQTMLYQIEQSLFSTRRPQRVREAIRGFGAGRAVEMQADDDSDSDSNTDSEASCCEICMHRQRCCMDGALLRHLHCDIDSTSSSESESERRANLAFLTSDFDENPQQFWSMTSSEDENENEEELGDEESWDSWQSDFEDDDDSFDEYMVRLLRGHAHGHWSGRQSNVEWARPAQHTDGIEWDVGSCDSNDEYEEICSVITDSSEEDLDAWQYNEDHSFETELSRPIRRLIGEVPAQTAQQERHSWRHFVQLCEFRSDFERELDREPLHSLTYHGFLSEHTDRRSERLRRQRTSTPPPNHHVQHVEPSESRHMWDHVYAVTPNAQMNCLRQTIRAMVVANRGNNSDSDSEIYSEFNSRDDNDSDNDNENEDTEMEFEMNDQEHEHDRRTICSDVEVDGDMEVDVGLDMDAQVDQIEPLATFLQQTDELIAKLMAALKL